MAFGPVGAVEESLGFMSSQKNLMHYAFIIRIQSLNLIPFKEESQAMKSSCNYYDSPFGDRPGLAHTTPEFGQNSTMLFLITTQPMEATLKSLKSLKPGETPNYTQVAAKYGINRVTLLWRHWGVQGDELNDIGMNE